MHSLRLTIWGVVLAALLCACDLMIPAAVAQGAVAPPVDVTEKLASLTGRAAMIFTGQVASISRRGDVVEITFNVEQTVEGTPGTHFVLREWAGLWPPGQFRYTVGERALVFLHAASGAGFASPVDGSEGIVPVIVQGVNAPQLLDVRRLAAAVLRTPGTPLLTEANGAIQLTEAVSLISEVTQTVSRSHTRRLTAPVRFPFRGSPLQNVSTPARSPDTDAAPVFEPLPIQRSTGVMARVALPANEVNREVH